VLESIENVNNQFRIEEFFSLKDVRSITDARMHDLNINPSKTFDSMQKILNDLFKNGKLTLNDFGFKDESIKVLSKILINKNNLYSLDLTCNKVGVTNIDSIMELISKNDNITELILNSNNVTSTCFNLLIESLVQCNHIMSLSLMNSVSKQKNVINLKDVKNFDYLITQCKTLKILNLSNVKIGDDGVKCLARKFDQSFISKLNISSCSITDKSASKIAYMLREGKLISLDISLNTFTLAGCQLISDTFKEEYDVNLENLNISNCQLKYDSINAFISSIRTNLNLHVLTLDKNN